jgi:hypothetical protein
MAKNTNTFGLLAEFDTPAHLYAACEKVRDAGYTKWDAHSPFPVHNLDKAMGLKPTRLSWIALGGGLTGATLGMGLQWWVNTQAYPIIISGKPFFSWPAFIPVTFELTILFSALGAVLGMFGLNKLPRHHHPLFVSERFERHSDDKFFISIEAVDPKFDESASANLLREIGATYVEVVREDA